LDNLDSGLIKFEKNPKDNEVEKELMRHAHTLKGISAEMGYGEISNLAHSFEGMVENIKNEIASGGVGTLFGVLDELRKLISNSGNLEEGTKANPLVDEVGELEKADKDKNQELTENPEMFKKISEVKVRTEKLDKLVNLVAELVVSRLSLETQSKTLDKGLGYGNIVSSHGKLIEELQYQVLQLRLTPLFHVFNRFPRMVRDLAVKTKKKVDFKVEGGDIELDRNVLDIIGEPIVHILRNAVDHGLEKEGSVTLSAERLQDHVVIKIADDGAGIEWEKLKSKMKESGVGDDFSQEKIKNFMFSGVSTSEEVTEISGRGVGLGVVKVIVEELGGSVDVESPVKETGKGTAFMLKVPVSLAIIKALLVEIEKKNFAIPMSSVERLLNLEEDKIKTQADQRVVAVDGMEIPVISTAEKFGLNDGKELQKINLAIISNAGGKRTGFLVDKAVSQQDIIVKRLNKTARQDGFFSAVTILGDGKPVPIIDFETLVGKL